MPKTYSGSCHRGAVRFEIDADIAELTTCDCSLCRKKNALMTKVQESALRLLAGADALKEHRWNTRIARHYFCSACGIYLFHRKRAAPDHFGVNVFCLDDFDPAGAPVLATEGATMSVSRHAANPLWPGPRETA